MRILYVDIDSTRPDHIGCYGYHRNTTPNIDRLAETSVRFNNCYTPDAPCLPSRTALFSGRFGIHTGVVNHGGEFSDPFKQGTSRSFRSELGSTCWMNQLRNQGHYCGTISPFGERHSAFHWYAGFNEIINTGGGGNETADEVSPVAMDWLDRNGNREDWFLHLNFWDPHTPYRTPMEYGDPFKDEPLPAWYTEEIRQAHWQLPGPHSPQEFNGYSPDGWMQPGWEKDYPRAPSQIDSMDAARRMFDGYDTGLKFADEHLGRVLNKLSDMNLYDDTIIIISADHGENLGELHIYGDHQTADHITSRVPLIIRAPGITTKEGQARVDDGLVYNVDMAATTIELAGGSTPENWDGQSFAPSLKKGESWSRDYLVVSQNAWCSQRSVRWKDYLYTRTYHDSWHGFPDKMLFNVAEDPHEQDDLADSSPEIAGEGAELLEDWHTDMMRTASHGQDPLWEVIREGGPSMEATTKAGPIWSACVRPVAETGRINFPHITIWRNDA